MLRKMLAILSLCTLAMLVGCFGGTVTESQESNPASQYCEQQGGETEWITNPGGVLTGLCILKDGTVCDEWAYFQGKCPSKIIPMEPTAKPGYYEEITPSPSPYAGPTVTPTPGFADDGCLIYHNSELGYTFHYPGNAMITSETTTTNGVTITGQLVDSEHWPVIFFNHPTDRLEYAVPYEFDLEKWLTGANLLSGTRQADTTVAGLLAIHLRHDNSPQAFDDDEYFFAHNGQLYSVVFLHAGGKEDWDFYNHFLENIRFEK